MERISTEVCIAGGGPAGMMLGLLLARAGIKAVVLEKHADFLRDFRGDTIHPSTLEVMHELGLLDGLLALPHQKAPVLRAWIGDTLIPVADFTHLPTHCGFIALMPQWDFLNYLAGRARRYPTFDLRMRAEATGLIRNGDRIEGVRAVTPEGQLEVVAKLVVGADGRRSTMRMEAGLQVQDFGAPMDVLWFAISRTDADPEDTAGRFDRGRIIVMINRGAHWQFGYVIAKGSIDRIRAQGLPAFREDLARLAPFVRDRTGELKDWDDVKLLTVTVDRLREWCLPGLFCIGDAAHAMSPVGGVGINLAIQDAVATANILTPPLRENRLKIDDLRRVQRRREFPTRVTQAAQLLIQRRIIGRVLGQDGVGQDVSGQEKKVSPPLVLRLFSRFPVLRRIPARLLGIGVRPEHVRSPEAG